jgi:hypothetical protein
MIRKDQTGHKESRREFLQEIGAGAGAAAIYPALVEASPQGVPYPDLAKLREAHQKHGMVPAIKAYRMMEWEFHTPPEATFDIDVEGAMRATRDAGAQGVLLYTQGCWGYSFYPSHVGVRQPKLDYDLFGKEVDLAHQMGMSVTAYYCLQMNNQLVLSHPDWGWVNEKGEQQKYRFYFMCLDSPYRQYVLGMMHEIFSRYKVEELFLDVFGIQFAFYQHSNWDPFCFCKHTEAAWDRDHPGDPYRAGFATRAGLEARYLWHQKRTMVDMLDEITAIVRQYQPQTLISFNGGPESFPQEIMQRASFLYNEPVATNSGIALGAIISRGWARPDYQGGVFSQFGYMDTYPASIARVQADSLIVQNSRTFFVGNAPVIGGLDGIGYSKRWFGVARENWEDVRNVECLLPGLGEPIYSAAVLFSEATRYAFDLERRPSEFRLSTLGALEALANSGRPMESIPEFRLTREVLDQFELLVLPETEVLSTSHAELIRQWVGRGGTLIASFKCGLLDETNTSRPDFALADVFGVQFMGEEKKYAYDSAGKPKKNFIGTYLEGSSSALANPLPPGTVGLPGSFLNIKLTSAEEVMHYRLPVMVEDLPKNEWFNWGPPPPAKENSGPAVAYQKFGKGQSLYIGVPIFRAVNTKIDFAAMTNLFWIQKWISTLIRQLVPSPAAEIVVTPHTEYFHGSFFFDKSRKFILLQMLNTIELLNKGEFQMPVSAEARLDATRLRVTGARMVWPETRDLSVRTDAGRTIVSLPEVKRYAAVYLRLG